MMTVLSPETERVCRECQFHKLIMEGWIPKHICVACDTKEAEEWGKTHECPLKPKE
jgi:hypothetical protein